MDYVLFAQAGLEAFDYKTAYASSVPPEGYDPATYDPATDPLSGIDGTSGFVFVFCSLANFMAFFMVSVIHTIKDQRSMPLLHLSTNVTYSNPSKLNCFLI